MRDDNVACRRSKNKGERKKMNEQIKSILCKFAFAAAILAAFMGFTVFADAALPLPEISPVEASATPDDDKPTVRCPNKSFLLRTPCKTIKPVKTGAEKAGAPVNAPEKTLAGDNRNSSPHLP